MSLIKIIDSEKYLTQGDSFRIFWNSFSQDAANTLSIPSYIEKFSLEIRQEYLKFVFSLGHSTVKKKSIQSQLALNSEFSFWWTSLISQKCNYSKSPELNNIIKFIGFKHWAAKKNITSIHLYSSNKDLGKTFKLFCKATDIKFSFISLNKNKLKSNRTFVNRAYHKLPMMLQATIWAVIYAIERWNLKGINLSEWKHSNSKVMIMSYLLHLDPSKFQVGEHQSGFWGPLPKLLNKDGENISWIHIYEKNSLIPSTKDAAKSIKNFSKNSEDIHVVLETFLSFSLLFKSGFDWFKLMKRGYPISKKLEAPHNITINHSEILPMIKKDFNKSIFGQEGLRNIITFHLLNSALRHLPNQNLGILPCEFQPQELSFTYLFKKFGHKNLVANCHSTIRFWDLRYHFDKNIFTDKSQNCMPLPDYVSVNGQNMHDALRQSNFDDKKIIQVEALRYLYLEDTKNFSTYKIKKLKNSIDLLVMGDYLMENNIFLLESLRDAILTSKFRFNITFKYHPACPVNEDDFPGVTFHQTSGNMVNLLSKSDIALAGNVTSASVDAICYGIPVVSLLDGKKLNMNPLRGQAGAFFASSPIELCFILENYERMLTNDLNEVKSDYFNLDSSLTRWKKLMKSCLN
jgi:surface carbohydrate biosynthesis protein (TIGR04326 family)